jgi:hypothetical protein
MRWKEAIQQASNGGMAFRVEESVDHMAAIWPADGIVFVGDEDLSTPCGLRTRLRSEQLVERLLEEFAISSTGWEVHYSTQDLEERELSGSLRGTKEGVKDQLDLASRAEKL